jgi:hypothetical protein
MTAGQEITVSYRAEEGSQDNRLWFEVRGGE